jgi:serine/threonine-protein kinase
MNTITRLNESLTGRYTIERELGAGGMATVYLAHDLKHDRHVALKVLKPELAAVLGAERFVVEIKTTAALQHPHILPLFDSGTADSFLFYVMPFIDGETLRAKLDRETQLGVDEAVRIAREVLDALEYAHQHGIVHRDIKPENILLHGGHAMVADFGIALAVSAAAGGRMTETGLSLGTPHYMSPEQATAEKEITARSDVYSLGSVLYEMLTGNPPHTGASAQQIIMKIITEAARPVTELRKAVPANVAAAVAKALEKLPADRFESAKAFGEALNNADFTTATAARGEVAAAATGSLRARTWAAAPWVLLAGLVLFAATDRLRSRSAAPPPVTRFALRVEGRGELIDGAGSPIAVSPDGSKIVYVGRDSAGVTGLFLRALDRELPVLVAGTSGAFAPFFSPDGDFLGFVKDGKIQTAGLKGGSVTKVADWHLGGLTWGSDGFIYYTAQGLYRVRSTGGRPELVLAVDSTRGEAVRFPDALPSGHAVLVTLVRGSEPRLAAVSVADGKLHDLGLPGMYPRFVDGGYLTFLQSDGTLFCVPFDAKRLKITGPAVPIESRVRIGPAFAGKMGISRTGTIAYLAGALSAGISELVIQLKGGKEIVVGSPAGSGFSNPRFSPDGQRLAVEIRSYAGANAWDIWTYDIPSANLARLTFDSVSRFPAWMPDGKHVVSARRTRVLYKIAADGSGAQESLAMRPGGSIGEASVLSDGKGVVYRVQNAAGNGELWLGWLDSASAGRPLVATSFRQRGIAVSADDRWLAYESNETGSDEIYVRRLEAGSGRWKVTRTGGREPRWGPGGRELFYRVADTAFVVGMTPSAEPQFTSPRIALVEPFYAISDGVSWDISQDGSRFAFTRAVAEPGVPAIHVVMHWFDRLRAAQAGKK